MPGQRRKIDIEAEWIAAIESNKAAMKKRHNCLG